MPKYLVIILWLSMLGLTACDKPVEKPLPPRPALVMKVGEMPGVDQRMVLVGEVKSRYESNIGFRIGGKITKRLVEIGQSVKKGQAMATLDPSDVQLDAQAAKADVAAAEANLVLARAELERQKQLYEKKFISKSALDIREAEYKTAASRLEQAKSQYSVSSNQTRYTHLLADREGVVANITAEPGQVVSAGQTIAQIVDYRYVEVAVDVPESRMQGLTIGLPVEVRLWADTQTSYAGKIREIAPAANSETRTFGVRISLDHPDDQVKIGMTAGVNFGGTGANAITVPSTAITELEGKTYIWVISEQGIAHRREVVTGQFTESGVPVTQGLSSGELIAIAGVHTLVEGQPVSIQMASQERSY